MKDVKVSKARVAITTKKLTRVAMMTALIAVSAFIKIPMQPVPITMQVALVTLAALLLGSKLGTLSVIIYVALGLAGIPIFINGGGLSYVLQPSFGYLIGFIFAAFFMGLIAEHGKTSIVRYLLASVIGMFVIYLFGAAYYYFIATVVLSKSVAVGWLVINFVLVFIPGDLLFNIVAAVVAVKLKKIRGFQ